MVYEKENDTDPRVRLNNVSPEQERRTPYFTSPMLNSPFGVPTLPDGQAVTAHFDHVRKKSPEYDRS